MNADDETTADDEMMTDDEMMPNDGPPSCCGGEGTCLASDIVPVGASIKFEDL